MTGATRFVLPIVLGGALLLAVLNLGTAPGSAAHVPTYAVSLAGKYLCYAILALAVDLVWGFAGILASATPRSSPSAATRWACT